MYRDTMDRQGRANSTMDRHMANRGVIRERPMLNLQVLRTLGFNEKKIIALIDIYNREGRINNNTLSKYNFTYEQMNELKYMYKLALGEVVIDSERDLIKHLRKTFGRDRRIGINDLALSKINKVPKMAVVAGIKQEPFNIYNSGQYKMYGKLYPVIGVTPTNIIVETTRKPKLKWKESKKVEGVVEIRDVTNDKLIVAFSKNVCRLCNRFIVVASLRRPEYHHGMIEILCIEGTKVYVYAQTLKSGETIKYNHGSQRVYTYGFFPFEIRKKVDVTSNMLFKMLGGISSKYYPANSDFIAIPREESDYESKVEYDFDED